MKEELPFSLKLIRGAIGKDFVIKHYKYGPVKTKYPLMSGIIASVQQRKCRNLFREAVIYAMQVIADPDRKACWQKKLRKPNFVYNAAIKEYMIREKKAKQKEFIVTNRLLRNAMMKFAEENDRAENAVNTIAIGIDRPESMGIKQGDKLLLNFIERTGSNVNKTSLEKQTQSFFPA